MSFESNAVVASGVTPRAKVLFATVALGGVNYELIVHDDAVSVDAGPDGVARLALVDGIETRSIWLVADSSKDAGYTIAAPNGMLLREMDFPGRAPEKGETSGQLVLNRRSVEAFLIRPHVGIWSAAFRDGGSSDSDETVNGQILAHVDDLAPAESTPPKAERIKPGDLLFLVDRMTLEFHVMRQGE